MRFPATLMARTPDLKAFGTVTLMMWPRGPKTGCRTFRHTAEITDPIPENDGATTLCHSHTIAGARVLRMNPHSADSTGRITARHTADTAMPMPVRAGANTLRHNHTT